jgi:hypothetical protein
VAASRINPLRRIVPRAFVALSVPAPDYIPAINAESRLIEAFHPQVPGYVYVTSGEL